MEKYCVLSGGCFWCMSKPYYEYDGIKKVYSGYCGGTEVNPTYEEVKQQKTSHMESIKLIYDDEIITYNEILDIYFDTIDPFDDGGQFIDRGYSYSLAIFYQDEFMYNLANEYIKKVEEKFKRKVYVKLIKEMPFYMAEEYHQDFAIKNKEEMENELKISGRKNKEKNMIIIKNANLISMEEINYEICDILIENGLIKQIGKIDEKKYPTAKIINANGKYVTPGLVDPHCHVGLMESTIGWAGSDVNESVNPVTPELRGIDGIKPHDECFKEALESGVTTVCAGPGSANLIGGTFAVLKTKGKTVDEMILVKEVAMKMALGENPKRVYGNSKTSPSTRMASAAIIREWLFKAKNYYEKKKESLDGKYEFNMKLESLSRVFDGFPVKIHAHQADDIATAMRIGKEFNLKMTVDHCTEGYLIADELKANNQMVILGPVMHNKSKYELKAKSFESGKILYEKGVLFSIMTDHPVIEQKHTLIHAALFVKAGLPELEALKAVTINAAKTCYVDHLVGSIKEGKHADIVIWSKHPLDIMSEAETVILNGNIEK